MIVCGYPASIGGAYASSRTSGGLRWTRGCIIRRGMRACVRQKRVVLIPRRWNQPAGPEPGGTAAKKPGHRGERAISRKTIAQGRPACSGVPVILVCFLRLSLAHEAAGATCIRPSLRPLSFEGHEPGIARAGSRREDAESCDVVPGWCAAADPEPRDSGFDASHRPGMTREEGSQSPNPHHIWHKYQAGPAMPWPGRGNVLSGSVPLPTRHLEPGRNPKRLRWLRIFRR